MINNASYSIVQDTGFSSTYYIFLKILLDLQVQLNLIIFLSKWLIRRKLLICGTKVLQPALTEQIKCIGHWNALVNREPQNCNQYSINMAAALLCGRFLLHICPQKHSIFFSELILNPETQNRISMDNTALVFSYKPGFPPQKEKKKSFSKLGQSGSGPQNICADDSCGVQ